MPTEAVNRELVLADNEQALIQDTTKGHVTVYVGPHKASLSETDRPVVYEKETRKFERCQLEQSKQLLAEADEGSYIVLENPTANDNEKKPEKGSNNSAALQSGRKINVPGPVKFPTWPGQIASVIPGHNLKTNQYLIAKIYNDKAAEENWDKGVVKVQEGEEGRGSKSSETLDKPSTFAIGKLFIVPGTKASFYIPPTGIEVVPDERGRYVREAVTLERLEYCVLLDESGDKRYEKGPAVIFPEPTEIFIEDEETGDKVFKAEELNHLMGIHIKVIAPYEEGEGENKKTYKVGDELFITGKGVNETTIYYPRNDHAIIKYGDEKIHYAIAIPKGEARYVLNRETGEIRTENGPKMFLPDPRKEVVIRRILDPKLVNLLYPGNDEALKYNVNLSKSIADAESDAAGYVTQESYLKSVMNSDQADAFAKFYGESVPSGSIRNTRAKKLGKKIIADDFNRRTKYTPPRTLTLNTKYDGAVAISIWNGYAVRGVDKEGNRNVEIGPKTILLEYDQTLEVLELSTGKPKTTDSLLRTVYLRVLNNKISDILEVETEDLCPVELKLSYRVNFVGEDHSKWFDVENYVKFLCDHIRSLLKRELKNHGIREFHNNAIDIVRNCILGAGTGDERAGRLFEENNMRIYDVEVLSVTIKDQEIANLLVGSQHDEVKQQLEVEDLKRQLALTREREAIKIAMAESENETLRRILEIEKDKTEREEEVSLIKTESKKKIDLATISAQATTKKEQQGADIELQKAKTESSMALQEVLDKIKEAEVGRERMTEDLKLDVAKRLLENQVAQLRAEASAVKDKAEAISPDLIAALQAFSDKELAAKAAESMAPLAMIQKTGVMNILSQLLDGSPLSQAAIGTVIANSVKDKIPGRKAATV